MAVPHRYSIVPKDAAAHVFEVRLTVDAMNFKASDPLKARLMLAGFKVHEIDVSEFLKAGGSAKCLTLKLNEAVRPRAKGAEAS